MVFPLFYGILFVALELSRSDKSTTYLNYPTYLSRLCHNSIVLNLDMSYLFEIIANCKLFKLFFVWGNLNNITVLLLTFVKRSLNMNDRVLHATL